MKPWRNVSLRVFVLPIVPALQRPTVTIHRDQLWREYNPGMSSRRRLTKLASVAAHQRLISVFPWTGEALGWSFSIPPEVTLQP
ncbi:MAG: hypothetical protein ACRD1K_20530 [Acidimicrobiales bacterium]